MNPVYDCPKCGERVTYKELEEMRSSAGNGLWDSECTVTIRLNYTDTKTIKPYEHKIEKSKQFYYNFFT